MDVKRTFEDDEENGWISFARGGRETVCRAWKVSTAGRGKFAVVGNEEDEVRWG